MSTLRLGSANVMNNPIMAKWKVRKDFKDVKRDCDIVGWQEISSLRNLTILLSVLGVRWKTVFKGTATPISLRRRRFKILDRGKIVMHTGKKGASPIRRIVWILVFDKVTGLTLVFSNRHYVSGAWNDKDKYEKEWRKMMWDLGYLKDRELAVQQFDDDILHIGVGDFNRLKVERFLVGQKWIWNKGIDKMFIVDPNSEISGWGKRRDSLESDHSSIQAAIYV